MNFKGAMALLAFAAIHAFAVRAETQERQATVWPTKVWEVSTPEEQGMDLRAVARLIDDVGTYKQDSVLIVRNGKMSPTPITRPTSPVSGTTCAR